MVSGGGDRPLEDTPTWAIAGVSAVFVVISVLIEHGIHKLSKWFQKRQKKAMSEALEKIKAELMLLGFISLLLTVGGTRRLLISDHRILAATGSADYCTARGKISLISQTGVHQLHIFIFVLAVFHVLYSVITMALGKAKMKKWKAWESETSSLEYEFTNDPLRFRFTHQTSFVKRHSGLSTAPGIKWIVAFFRQFFGSVTKVDYLTMRRGFVNAHFSPSSKFDFHKYIQRCMEDDFKVVVGISTPLWFFAIIFLLLTVYRWHTLSWLTGVPLVITLLVGTKLELVIMEMAREIQDKCTIVTGAPVVEPNNKFFWFERPQWILFLVHYTLFQNAFQMAFFLWSMYEFGVNSCFNENFAVIVVTIILGVALQFVCSYITFPLYSLVTQMGTHMKQAIFEEQTAKALKKWRKAAKDRKKLREVKEGAAIGGGMSSPRISDATTPSASPLQLLHKFKIRSHQPDIEGALNSPTYQFDKSDNELSDVEHIARHTNNHMNGGHDHGHQPRGQLEQEQHFDGSHTK